MVFNDGVQFHEIDMFSYGAKVDLLRVTYVLSFATASCARLLHRFDPIQIVENGPQQTNHAAEIPRCTPVAALAIAGMDSEAENFA